MSYILDALRKADAQRERDPARGIHAQPARAPMGTQAQPVRERPWFWAAGAAGVAAVAAAGWYLYRDTTPPQPESAVAQARVSVPPVAAPVVPPPVVAAAPAVLPPPVVVAPPLSSAPPAGGAPMRVERSVGSTPPVDGAGRRAQSALAPSRAIVPAQATVIVPPAGSAASSVMPGAVAPQPNVVAPQPEQPPPGMTPPAPLPAPAPAPIPPAPPTPPVAGLPADAPKLVITGGVYSANKSQRMLIVNGQVVGEGADLGSGVSVEEIKPKTAVLRFRGGRYTVTY